MACFEYEIGIRDRDGRMMTRTWSKADTLKAVPWLKRENAKGADIYVRPAGEQNQGLVLVDDLTVGQVEKMKASGFAPAVLIETSPMNHQAWVRVSAAPLEPELATALSRALARKYEADPNSADWRHFGRLAGFTNRKPEHVEAGRNPWVLCHEANGNTARAAPDALEAVKRHLEAVEVRTEREKRLAALKTALDTPGNRYNPVTEYQRQAKRLLAKFGENADLSRMDWMIATDMAQSGRFVAADIAHALAECSPNVESRKAGHLEDYAQRTAAKAWAARPPEQEAGRKKPDRDDPDLSR
jgi:hypothetical protein